MGSSIMAPMLWTDLEKAFSRAALLSFSKAKLILAFPALALCGILTVFCRAAAFGANEWILMSLAFLPIFLSSVILLALGVLLIRIHHHEAKHLSIDFKKIVAHSTNIMIGTSYLAILPTLAYLGIWLILGLFFLLRAVPVVGDFFSVIFSFGPFLLIFSSLLLCIVNLGLLFFVAPAAALQARQKMSLAKRVTRGIAHQPFSSIVLFLIAFVPIGIVGGLLSLSAIWTNMSFTIAERSLSVALEWFFIMLPFCAILSPVVVFFFNFAAESYQILRSEEQG